MKNWKKKLKIGEQEETSHPLGQVGQKQSSSMIYSIPANIHLKWVNALNPNKTTTHNYMKVE